MRLRKITESDLLMMLEWRNHPQVRSNMYHSSVISREEHLNWYQQIKDDASKEYFIFENEGTAYGVVAFSQINLTFCNASWAFYASPNAPVGTGSRMEFLALEYAFNSLKMHKLYCEVISFNEKVIKLHKKFGFQVEGIFNHQVFVDNQFYDVYRLAIFANVWDKLKVNFQHKLFRKR